MSRVHTFAALVGGLALLVGAAPPAGAIPASDSGASPAITVDSTTVSTSQLVRELRIIAANRQLAKVLAKDDIRLVTEAEHHRSRALGHLGQHAREPDRGRSRVRPPRADRLAPRTGGRPRKRQRPCSAARPCSPRSRGRSAGLSSDGRSASSRSSPEFPARNEPTEEDLRLLLAQSQAAVPRRQAARADPREEASRGRRRRGAARARAPTSRPSRASARSTRRPRRPAASTRASARPGTWRRARPSVGRARRSQSGARPAPLKVDGGYAVLTAVPFTFENARPLLDSTWRARAPERVP